MLHFFRTAALPQLLVSVYPDQPHDTSWESQCRLWDHIAPHGVADENDPLEIQLLHDGCDIVAIRLNCPFFASDPESP